MIDLLLPWRDADAEARAHQQARAIAATAPWLRPQPLGVTTTGVAMVLDSLALAPARPLLVWCGAGPLAPTSLEPDQLLTVPLPAAPPAVAPAHLHWPQLAQALGFEATSEAPWYDLSLVWVPDAAGLAAAWQAADAILQQLLPHGSGDERLIAAFSLAQLRLAAHQRLPDGCRLAVADSGVDDLLQAAIWQAEDPHQALNALIAQVANEASADDRQRAQAVRAALLLRQPEHLAGAWQHLKAMAPDPAWWSLRLQVWHALGRPAGWRPFAGRDPHSWIAGLPQDELRLLAQVLQRQDLDPPGLLQQVQHHLQAPVGPLFDVNATAVYAVAAPSLRRACWPWASLEAADPSRLCAVQHQVCGALASGRGFSLVRLGDGEGLFLAGRRPCLGGATINGERSSHLSAEGHLQGEEHRALIDTWLQAVLEADVVGLPDQDQCLRGPEHYPLVASTLGRALGPRQLQELGPRLLPGGCHLHLFWLASGAYEQPPFLNVHGLIAPLLPPALAGRVAWQPIPGEWGHHPVAEGPAHYPVVYWQTLDWIAAQAAPGRLFLVGAGLLGKMYCAAIRRQGGVAVDVGSLIDLCGDQHTSRGEFRFNPGLPTLARRAFVQPSGNGCSG
ncbi:MAG: hypothetical protein ACKO2F_01620 [Cyanobacteriota bacterium]